MPTPTITVEELKKKLDNKEDIILLDVRENWERDIAALPNDIHIPMTKVRTEENKLPKNKDIIVYCRSGNRSAFITDALVKQGFHEKNLLGGTNEWAKKIDKKMRVY